MWHLFSWSVNVARAIHSFMAKDNFRINTVHIIIQLALALPCSLLLGCAEVPVTPQAPAPASSRAAPENAGELFVLIRPVVAGPDRRIQWIVLVDGEPRAILPHADAYTKVPVSPGEHLLTVGLHMQSLLFWVPLPMPIPEKFQREVQLLVSCAARERCAALIVEHAPSAWSGTVLSARPLPADEIDEQVHGLLFKEANR